MSSVEIPALIAGAGPTGLTMAAELLRHGVRCRVVDKLPERAQGSRALAIQARTLETFELMGIVDRFLKIGWKWHSANLYSEGKQLLNLKFDELESPYAYMLAVQQSESERLLAERVAELGGPVERPVELTGFAETGDGIRAQLKRGDGEESQVAAKWIIGCDGSHSVVRHQLGIPFEGASYDEHFIYADLELVGLPDDQLHIFFAPEGLAGIFPVRPGMQRVLADNPADDSDQSISKDGLEQLMRARSGVDLRVKNVVDASHFRIHHRLVAQLRKGRGFLCGDAAHVHSPAGGQGMNFGIQDAVNLAWKIGLVHAGVAGPALLDSYEKERYPLDRALLRRTDALLRMATLESSPARFLRDKLVPLVMHNEVFQSRMRRTLAEISLDYRDSPIVGEHGMHSGPHAGDRAPDVDDVYQMLAAHRHLLLVFGEPNAAILQVEERFQGNLKVIPIPSASEQLRKAYGADRPCVYWIRADGYIGYRCSLDSAAARLAPFFDGILAV